MPRRTRKQLVEATHGNEDLAQLVREEECQALTRELRRSWRLASPAATATVSTVRIAKRSSRRNAA